MDISRRPTTALCSETQVPPALNDFYFWESKKQHGQRVFDRWLLLSPQSVEEKKWIEQQKLGTSIAGAALSVPGVQ